MARLGLSPIMARRDVTEAHTKAIAEIASVTWNGVWRGFRVGQQLGIGTFVYGVAFGLVAHQASNSVAEALPLRVCPASRRKRHQPEVFVGVREPLADGSNNHDRKCEIRAVRRSHAPVVSSGLAAEKLRRCDRNACVFVPVASATCTMQRTRRRQPLGAKQFFGGRNRSSSPVRRIAPYRPILLQTHCRVWCTPDFTTVVQRCNPNKIMFLIVINDCNSVAFAFTDNL